MRKMMEKTLALGMALIVSVFLVSCGGSKIEKLESTAVKVADSSTTTNTSSVKETKQVVLGLNTTFTTLDPAKTFNIDSGMVNLATYDTLVNLENGEILPSLAEKWTISEDGLTYTFDLKKGVLFHTGNELTASDVVYCLMRVKNLKDNPAYLMNTVDSVEAPSSYEVVLHLNKVTPALLTILSASNFVIYDSKVAQENGGTGIAETDTAEEFLNHNSIGSGPYKLTSYTPQAEIILDKNDKYFGEKAKLDRLIIKHIGDPSTQLMELQGGDIDLAFDLTADQMATLDGSDMFKKIESSTVDIFFFMMNSNEKYGKEFSNPLVRKAVSYALDYEGLCLLAGNNAVTPAGIFPIGMSGSLGLSTKTRDVEKAKALLAEAGYPNGFTFDCAAIGDMAPDGVSFMTMAEKVQQDLSEVGLKLNIVPQEVSVYLENYRGGTSQSLIGMWGPSYNDPDCQLSLLAGNSTAMRANWTADMAPLVADLAKQAAVESDTDKRAKLIEEIQIASDDAGNPFNVILQPGRVWLANKRLTELEPNLSYWLDLRSINID